MASKKGSSFYSMPLPKRKFNFSEVEESSPKEIDSIKVYLRVKPYEEREINESNNVFEVADSNTLLVKASGRSKKLSRGNEEYSYTFTHIFPSDVSQKEVFEESVKESVVDFINGFSSLIFSYGTTNAGKTFTVQGTTQQPGLIPRALCLVFKSIEESQTDDVEYIPCGRIVKRMSEQERKNHTDLKQTIINHRHIDDSQSSTKNIHKLSHESGFDFEIIDSILEKETDSIVVVKPASTYSLWISFYEIYNECIYDLLTAPLTPNCQRKQLKIGEDAAKNSFVKELNYVNVTSIQEARKVLIYGRNNLQVAMTGLNAQSSRSHCIFTLTLVCSPEAAETGDNIVISQLALCDLAGTERQKKTFNVGERLKESQHINCSLHVLSRCFDIIRENQNRADRSVIPYRESKLTKLFQKALRGEEKIIMLVNINLTFSLDDTHQVLKTSAIARKTTTSIKPWQQKKRRSRSVMLRRSMAEHSRSMKSTLTRSTLTEVDVEEDIDEEYSNVSNVHGHSQQIVESLLSTIDTQKKKIASYQSKVEELEEVNTNLEDELRQELAVEYGKLIKTIETRLKQRIEDKTKVINEKELVIAELERRLRCQVDGEAGPGSCRKKRKVFDCSLSMIEPANESKADEDDIDLLRAENDLLKNDVSSLKSTLAHYKNENSELSKKYAEIKLLRRIESIATLKEAVVDEDMVRVLDEMDRMKEKFEAELTKRNALIKEAMDEMMHLEATYNEVLSENGKLEGDLLVAKDELEDLKQCLAVANEVSAKKTEENQEMEIKLEKLETDNENLKDYIELAEAEIKCLKEKLMYIERNRTQSADIFEDSITVNEQNEEVFRDKYKLTNPDSLRSVDENSQNTLCKQLQNVSLEFGTSVGGEGEANSVQQCATFEVDSMNLSKPQPVQRTLQSTVTIQTETDTLLKSLSVTQPTEHRSKSLAYKFNLSNTFVNNSNFSLGNHLVTETFNRADQTTEVHEIAGDSLSIRSQTDGEEEPSNVQINQENKVECEDEENEQKVIELTKEIEEIKQNNHSLILLVDQLKEEKIIMENKNGELNKKLSELSHEIDVIKNFHSTTVNLIENFGKEKEKEKALFEKTIEKLSDVKEMQQEEIKQLKDIIEVNNSELKQRESALESNQELLKNSEQVRFEMEEMVSELKISKDELLACNRILAEKSEQLEKEIESKNEAYERLAQKFRDFKDEHESLMNEVDTRECRNREYAEENKKLIEERESLLQKLKDLQIDHDHLLNDVDSSNREYAEKNEKLMEELQSSNEKCERLLQRLQVVEADKERLMKELEVKNEALESNLQRLNYLEANNERLVVEVDTMKRDNGEYADKNQQLEEELKSKNEMYKSLSQKLNNLEAKHECFIKEMDTKESHLREVENELTFTRKDLELKSDEILKLQALTRTCKVECTTEKSLNVPSSNSKSKMSEHSDDDFVDNVILSPSDRENQPPTNQAPTAVRTERPSRIARPKTCESTLMKTLTSSSRAAAKRITRSAASTQAQSTKSLSSSPPHAQILKSSQSDMNCTSPAVRGRRLLAQPNAMPQFSLEEFPDDPQVDNESPVSILNRLTGTPAPQRKLRTRRKKQF
ncbi:hypothetical protein LSTR_LSTR007530 [Laodelphax striatellus]|uniref:Kinesin motor domain-containing protein n=1 Tax=Laodelphax striatellus TaxID=195883 RepID=A0A482XQS2_LAOST|nr:hypothetical protein LSTR_LSTR007530 [Laodelphax striatellus]